MNSLRELSNRLKIIIVFNRDKMLSNFEDELNKANYLKDHKYQTFLEIGKKLGAEGYTGTNSVKFDSNNPDHVSLVYAIYGQNLSVLPVLSKKVFGKRAMQCHVKFVNRLNKSTQYKFAH